MARCHIRDGHSETSLPLKGVDAFKTLTSASQAGVSDMKEMHTNRLKV